jgi:hypothetical protein
MGGGGGSTIDGHKGCCCERWDIVNMWLSTYLFGASVRGCRRECRRETVIWFAVGGAYIIIVWLSAYFLGDSYCFASV